MGTQDPPNRPRYQLTRGLIGLDNEKDAITSLCLDRKEVRGAIWGIHSIGTGWPVADVWQACLCQSDKQLSIG